MDKPVFDKTNYDVFRKIYLDPYYVRTDAKDELNLKASALKRMEREIIKGLIAYYEGTD